MPKCTRCKKREATENMKTCQSCRDVQNKRLKRKRNEAKTKSTNDTMTCTSCFKTFASAEKNYKICKTCRTTRARHVRESRKRKLEKVERAAKEGYKICMITACKAKFPITDIVSKTCKKCRESIPKGMKRCTRCHRSFPSCNYSQCTNCRKKRTTTMQKRKEKALKKTAKDGHKICKHCLKEKPAKEFQSTIFRRKKLTSNCLSCRNSLCSVLNSENSKIGQCKKIWNEWKTSHCCENCGTKECIEADHIERDKKIHKCSSAAFWAWNGGPEALKKELLKCRPLCRFCHTLHTSKQQGRDDQVWKVKKRNYVNSIKMKIGSCELCDRKVENESMCCAFDFDHLDVEKKRASISRMVNAYRLADFFECIDEEVAKCRLLCANCHKKHTKEQQRKASVVNMID